MSTAQEIELRLNQSLSDAAYPGPIGALGELLSRAMYETAALIAATNRIAEARLGL